MFPHFVLIGIGIVVFIYSLRIIAHLFSYL